MVQKKVREIRQQPSLDFTTVPWGDLLNHAQINQLTAQSVRGRSSGGVAAAVSYWNVDGSMFHWRWRMLLFHCWHCSSVYGIHCVCVHFQASLPGSWWDVLTMSGHSDHTHSSQGGARRPM